MVNRTKVTSVGLRDNQNTHKVNTYKTTVKSIQRTTKCVDIWHKSIQKLYSLTNIVRAFQSKLRNSKNHCGVDTRYVNVYSCPYKTSFPDHP